MQDKIKDIIKHAMENCFHAVESNNDCFPDDLDVTFGSDGRIEISFTPKEWANAVAETAANRILSELHQATDNTRIPDARPEEVETIHKNLKAMVSDSAEAHTYRNAQLNRDRKI